MAYSVVANEFGGFDAIDDDTLEVISSYDTHEEAQAGADNLTETFAPQEENETDAEDGGGENESSDDSGEEAEEEEEAGKLRTDDKVDYRKIAKPNPLSKFMSHTYGLAMYMVTPEAYNNFQRKGGTLTGIKGKNSGVYVVAQSGGINSTVEDRALTISGTPGQGPGFDYFLDDLELEVVMPGGNNKSTATTDIKFKITEAHGFNFLRDISIAADKINKMSTFTKDLDPAKRPNAVDQMFIMAVKFYGYDINGLPLDGDNAAVQGYDNGDKTDNNAVLQRYYAFKLADMKYVLNGRAVVYNCSGYLVQEIAAYGELNSSIQQKMQLEGGTVGECLTGEKGLLTLLNKANEKQVDTGKIKKPNILKVEFYDESGELVSDGDIERGTLVDDDSFAKSTAPMAKIKSTKDVTVAESFKQVKVDKNKRAINIDDGTNILTVIENLIIKSSYIGDALAAAKSIEADKNKTIKKTPIKELTWFNVQPSVTIIGRDENTNLWAYEIVYQVRPYKIPYLKTSVGSTVSKYPGPTKFYDYWLTGGNSEVLSYQQEYNSMLFMPQLQSSNKDEMAKTPKDGTPVGTKNAVPLKDNINMGAGRSTEINDLVAAQLYSPADNATAKIKIIGDPDYLMSSMGNPRITANKVFSGDGSIDGRNGQVFIQITFNTSFDYEPNTGLMRIDDRIQFYKTDKVKNLGIDGIVFRLTGVKSSLHKGKFEQELDCIIVSESELVGELADGEESKREGSDEGGSKSDNKPANSAKSSPQMVRSQSHDRLSANAPTEETEVSNVEIRGASGEDLDAFYGGGSGEPDETPEVEPTPQQDEDDDSADSLWDPFTDVAVEEYDDSGREDDPFADVQLAEDDDDNPRLA